MTTTQIAYVGPALSGRATSLAAVLRAGGSRANPLTLIPQTHHEITLGPRKLVAMVSTARASRFYENTAVGERDPKVRWEIDRLVEAHGIVFVADSQEERAEANLLHMTRLRQDLTSRGLDLDAKPLVVQANKRDLSNLLSLETLRSTLATRRCAVVESIATKGVGTVEALSVLAKLIDDV